MRYWKLLFILLLFPLAMASCEDISLAPVDCNECYWDEPEYGEIELKVTFENQDTEVYILVYEHSYHENNLIYETDVYGTNIYLTIPTSETFVFEALYFIDGRPYHVLHSAKLRTKLDNESCSESCYYVVPKTVDLRLKK